MATDRRPDRGATPGYYHQELDRALGLAGNTIMILEAVAPVATFFVYITVLFPLFGGFTFSALVIGFLLQIPMALCYAELGSAFPIAGGEYAMVARSVSRGSGFMIFGMMAFFFVTILASSAIGAGLYLQTLWPAADPRLVAVVLIVAGAVLGTFNIRAGAVLSGVFLTIEMIAIVIVVALGLMHPHDPVQRLFSTTVFAPGGQATPFTAALALSACTLGFYMFTGYGNAVVFAEETGRARARMGRAVLFPLLIIGVVLLVTTACAIIGAPSLREFYLSPSPTSYLVTTLGGATLNRIVSGLVFIALAWFIMLTTLIIGREFWSAARDKAWPTPVSRVLAKVHPRFRSPWIATFFVCAVSIPLCFVQLTSLVTVQGVVTIVYCAFMAIGALRIRSRADAPADRWRMPWWPWPPLVVLVALSLMLVTQTAHDLWITGSVLAASLVYYLVYLRPRSATHWVMLKAAPSDPGSTDDPRVPVSPTVAGEA